MEKNKKNRLNEVANFIEELSWLLEKERNISLKEISSYIREVYNSCDSYANIRIQNSNNKRSRFLVGVLPSLFLDEELFKSRDEIIDFAETVLHLSINRASKRSRMEYIGWIVCEVAKMDNSRLISLVSALENIIGDDFKIKEMKKAKREPNFSWNDTIIRLSNK